MSIPRRHWLILLLVVGASAALLGVTAKAPDPAAADASQYLTGAYHLARHGTFSEAQTDAPTAPAMGREPGYAAVLALLMRIDEGLARFRPSCLAGGCEPRLFRAAQWLNSAAMALAGACVWLALWWLARSPLAAWVGGAHIWLNDNATKGRGYVVSDHFALLLAALLVLALAWAVRRGGAGRWAVAGLALAALTLTKALFLYLALPAIAVALAVSLARARTRPRLLAATVAFALAWGAPVGAWAARNHRVGGEWTLTAGRAAIALSTRAALNRMDGRQWAAALVYWTRGWGDSAARRLFPRAVWYPLDISNPDGFYLRGQLGVAPRIRRLVTEQGLSEAAAEEKVAGELRAELLADPLWYAAVTVPVFYRGVMVDEFVYLSLPALIWLLVSAARRRRWALLLVVAPGVFNLLFYALVSLNIPRYQLTALPALAIATGVAAAALAARWRRRRARA